LSLLYAARAVGLFRLCRFLTRSHVRILCYHGGSIGDEHSFNSLLFCRAEFLDARLRWLIDNGFTLISLKDAVAMAVGDSARPHCPTVLTFDDGWFSTYKILHPVVHRLDLPATLYLCTSYFADGWPNLDVTLNYLIWRSQRRQAEIQGVHADVDGTYDLSEGDGRERLVDAARAWIRQNFNTREGVCSALEQFAAQLGVAPIELDLASRRFDFATAHELMTMRQQGWSIELHGHAHHYPSGRASELKLDLETCRSEIRNSGLGEASHYCYPSGDHDDVAHDVLSELGIKSAVTCQSGLIEKANGRTKFYLPRFLDGGDIHVLEFESEMTGFGHLLRRLIGRR
jgi:peptidoglycan/xylan/chitin deacetylase (PgdA/CDA1 family)